MEQNHMAGRNCKQQGCHSWGVGWCGDGDAQSRLTACKQSKWRVCFYTGLLGVKITLVLSPTLVIMVNSRQRKALLFSFIQNVWFSWRKSEFRSWHLHLVAQLQGIWCPLWALMYYELDCTMGQGARTCPHLISILWVLKFSISKYSHQGQGFTNEFRDTIQSLTRVTSLKEVWQQVLRHILNQLVPDPFKLLCTVF